MTATEVMDKINEVKRDEERVGVFINMFFFKFKEWEFGANVLAGDFLHITSKRSTVGNYVGTVIEVREITDIH